MSNKPTNNSEDADNKSLQQSDHCSLDVVASSPGSQSNSSSGRQQQRVVELLQDNSENNDDDRLADWIIGAEFYQEDVGQNSDHLSEDDSDEDEEDEQEQFNNIFIHLRREFDEEEMMDADDNEEDEDGFVLAQDDDYESSTDLEDDTADQPYDTTLPVAHHYLGDNLEESRGREVLIEGSVMTMPLFNLTYVVLFPGQVLPIKTLSLNYRVQMYLKNCISRGITTIGLMWTPSENPIGTTAEITNFSTDDDDDELKLILKGQQRFKLLSAPFESAVEGQIKILPEITLGDPNISISYSTLRFLSTTNVRDKYTVSKHPLWVLKKYEAKNLVLRIIEEIKNWCSYNLAKDPNEFSYWVAANLPISNFERMKALNFSSVESRLFWLLEMLEKSKVFGCSNCRNVICYKKDVFPMSSSGPQCSFVNAHGYIHDTLTVRSAIGLIQHRQPWSSECSWFPGYLWQVAHCDHCHWHIGWCYKSSDINVKPRRFYGLSRANVRLQTEPISTDSFQVNM